MIKRESVLLFVKLPLAITYLVVVIVAGCGRVEKSGRLDITLVIDSSGSMSTNDQENLRITGAKQIIDLSRPGDRIRLRKFSTTTSLVAEPTEIKGGKSRRFLIKKAESISIGGATDITQALERAWDDLDSDPQPDLQRYIVLLTDGKIEGLSGGEAATKASRQKLLNDLVPRYKNRGWTIYTIGLSENVDEELLKQISERTKRTVAGKEKGFYEQTNYAKDIPHIYTKMFAQMANWGSIYRGEGDAIIKLNERVDERAIIVLDKKPGTKVSLTLPDGKRASSSKKHGFHWTYADEYEILTKDKPLTGVYQIKFEGEGTVSCYSQSAFWVKLYPYEKSLYERREAVKVSASLMQNQQVYRDTDGVKLLEGVEFICEATTPQGDIKKSCLLYDDGSRGDVKAGDGTYIGYFGQTLLEGDYRVIVRVKGRTFERTSDAQTFSVKGGPSVEAAVDKESYIKNEPISISAKMLIPTVQARSIVDCYDAKGKYSFLQLEPSETQRFSQKFESTTTFGKYIFLVRTTGKKQDGTEFSIIQKLVATTGTPDIILARALDTFGNIFGTSGAVIAIATESRLGEPEVLSITRPEVENLEFRASQQREVWGAPAEEILLRPGGSSEIFVAMRTTVRPPKDKREGDITLNFQPQRNPNVYIEPSSLSFHYSIHPPMKGWQKLMLFVGMPFVVIVLAGFFGVLQMRLPLKGRLLLEPIGRTYTLRNRGFLGLRKIMTLGSGKCDIRIRDEEGQIKPVHAKLSRTKHAGKTRLLFVELETKNRRLLKDQDAINIGKYKLRYQNFKDK